MKAGRVSIAFDTVRLMWNRTDIQPNLDLHFPGCPVFQGTICVVFAGVCHFVFLRFTDFKGSCQEASKSSFVCGLFWECWAVTWLCYLPTLL